MFVSVWKVFSTKFKTLVVIGERLLNKTVDGFCVHIAAKIASHTLRLLLRRRFGIDVLTFESQPI